MNMFQTSAVEDSDFWCHALSGLLHDWCTVYSMYALLFHFEFRSDCDHIDVVQVYHYGPACIDVQLGGAPKAATH